jgi:hypothetical protein
MNRPISFISTTEVRASALSGAARRLSYKLLHTEDLKDGEQVFKNEIDLVAFLAFFMGNATDVGFIFVLEPKWMTDSLIQSCWKIGILYLPTELHVTHALEFYNSEFVYFESGVNSFITVPYHIPSTAFTYAKSGSVRHTIAKYVRSQHPTDVIVLAGSEMETLFQLADMPTNIEVNGSIFKDVAMWEPQPYSGLKYGKAGELVHLEKRIIVARSGAGKTTFSKFHPNVVDVDALFWESEPVRRLTDPEHYLTFDTLASRRLLMGSARSVLDRREVAELLGSGDILALVDGSDYESAMLFRRELEQEVGGTLGVHGSEQFSSRDVRVIAQRGKWSLVRHDSKLNDILIHSYPITRQKIDLVNNYVGFIIQSYLDNPRHTILCSYLPGKYARFFARIEIPEWAYQRNRTARALSGNPITDDEPREGVKLERVCQPDMVIDSVPCFLPPEFSISSDWCVTELVMAGGPVGFITERIPFYPPPGPGAWLYDGKTWTETKDIPDYSTPTLWGLIHIGDPGPFKAPVPLQARNGPSPFGKVIGLRLGDASPLLDRLMYEVKGELVHGSSNMAQYPIPGTDLDLFISGYSGSARCYGTRRDGQSRIAFTLSEIITTDDFTTYTDRVILAAWSLSNVVNPRPDSKVMAEFLSSNQVYATYPNACRLQQGSAYGVVDPTGMRYTSNSHGYTDWTLDPEMMDYPVIPLSIFLAAIGEDKVYPGSLINREQYMILPTILPLIQSESLSLQPLVRYASGMYRKVGASDNFSRQMRIMPFLRNSFVDIVSGSSILHLRVSRTNEMLSEHGISVSRSAPPEVWISLSGHLISAVYAHLTGAFSLDAYLQQAELNLDGKLHVLDTARNKGSRWHSPVDYVLTIISILKFLKLFKPKVLYAEGYRVANRFRPYTSSLFAQKLLTWARHLATRRDFYVFSKEVRDEVRNGSYSVGGLVGSIT